MRKGGGKAKKNAKKARAKIFARNRRAPAARAACGNASKGKGKVGRHPPVEGRGEDTDNRPQNDGQRQG